MQHVKKAVKKAATPAVKTRFPNKVPAEEMKKIREEYLYAPDDKPVAIKKLAEKYHIKPIDFAYYCTKNHWATTRREFQAAKRGTMAHAMPYKLSDTMKTRVQELDTAPVVDRLIVSNDGSTDFAQMETKEYSGRMNKEHLVMLKAIRENIAVSLDLTPEATKMYKNNPALLIQKLQAIAMDATENQNFYRLVNVLLDTMQKERALLGLPTSVKATESVVVGDETEVPLMNLHLFGSKGDVPQLADGENSVEDLLGS